MAMQKLITPYEKWYVDIFPLLKKNLTEKWDEMNFVLVDQGKSLRIVAWVQNVCIQSIIKLIT